MAFTLRHSRHPVILKLPALLEDRGQIGTPGNLLSSDNSLTTRFGVGLHRTLEPDDVLVRNLLRDFLPQRSG